MAVRSSWRPKTSRRTLAVVRPGLIFALLVPMLWAPSHAAIPLKASRVLVLADARARDGHVFRDADELGDVLGLLSLWGIPHDLLRLDTQVLRAENLIDPAGQPVYGAIVWAVRTDLLPRRFQEGAILREACLKHHISLIALGDRIDVPVVQQILGLHVLGWRECAPPLASGPQPHFLTRDEPPLPHLADEPWCASGPLVEPTGPEVQILLHAGDQPLVTARTLEAGTGTRAVWLGGDASQLLRGGGSSLGVRLLQRALVWSLGAVVVHDFDNTLLLRMDDPGAAQASYLRGWNYPTLSESFIREQILDPLRQHGARLEVFCCPGYVDSKSREILHSEQVDRVDSFGNRQDVRSMLAALGEGQKQGLIEIGSHGWTHLSPDLDTPPVGGSSWWTGSIGTEWSHDGWYAEFYDQRRDCDVPAEVQRQHMRTSCDWLESYFGRRPLAFCPPQHAVSGDLHVYARQMTGTLEIRLQGAEPKAVYRVFYGDEEDWTLVGDVTADAAGTIGATLAGPADVWLDGRGHFTLNGLQHGTQFVAGPIHEALGFDFALALRDRTRMSPAEREEFPTASQSCRQGGRITGHFNRETYQPPTRAAACTYQAAGRAGFGLAIDTACHSLSGEQVTTLQMVPVQSYAEDIAPEMASHPGLPTVFRFHDRDLILDADFLVDILRALADRRPPPTYLSAEEFAGYLHASWTLRAGHDGSLRATADLSAAACRYLWEHESTWTLLATDEVLAALRGTSAALVLREEGRDDQAPSSIPAKAPSLRLRASAGKGVRTFVLSPPPP